MEDTEFQTTVFSRTVGNLLKFVIVALICYVIYAYFSRPELDLSESYFRRVMYDYNYHVYKYIDKRPQNTSIAYTAMNEDKTIKINYINFKDAESCKEFYENFMNSVEDKHSLKLSRDYRIDRVSAEKQSYMAEYTFYIALYAKNSIAFANGRDEQREELEGIFDKLFEPTKFDFLKMK